MERLTPDDVRYPRCLATLDDPPTLTSDRALSFEAKRIAIVGSREPIEGVTDWARAVARRLAKRGVVIVSGGAVGVDRAAHEGALDVGGATWVVLPHGRSVSRTPSANRDLFEAVEQAPASRLIWPFRDDVRCDRDTPRARNKVLVGVADIVLVVQARLVSGSRNAIMWAVQLGRPVFIVPGLPWLEPFSGARDALRRGHGRPLILEEELTVALGLPPSSSGRPPRSSTVSALPKKSATPPKVRPEPPLDQNEKLVISVLSDTPRHLDQLASEAGLGIPPLLSALLTLSAKNVVVEGPDGFFRLEKSG